ncbi:histidine phosphatase family protein [Bacillus suaedaesalsae]|uniref:Histidine phosphatase family protein n=1 Tax=Bacillus suaedaesalsae TaxID=2810349 RepID=A0ABS2DH84_9BACI|nr:histidine phosphatase family protein [Bacillus suaedaesalsae]MBM6617385.1 histidine phosphatase family protein [Bacillus suaedaesalsae]
MNKILYVVRHCKASGQEREASLTEEGQQQANELSEFLSEYPIKRIISSPYKRTVESILPYAEKVGIEIEKDERLGERLLSPSNQSNWLELLEQSFQDLSFTLEGGESSQDAINRVKSLIEELVEVPEEHIALISHGNLATLLLKIFDEVYGFDEWKAMSNPDVYMIQLKSDGREVRRIWR